MSDLNHDEENEREIEAIRARLVESLGRLETGLDDLGKVLDSPRRLRAVSDVVDRLTDDELRALDNIIGTAHQATGVKWVALVLLDEQHAQVVSSMEPIPSGERAQSYCQMVVATARPWMVEDTRKHGLVSRWLSTKTYDVGAYLGVPVSAEGETVGALCMFQPEPRRWSTDDERVLMRFAALISEELERITRERLIPNDSGRLLRQRFRGPEIELTLPSRDTPEH